jgi:hypothetical protein
VSARQSGEVQGPRRRLRDWRALTSFYDGNDTVSSLKDSLVMSRNFGRTMWRSSFFALPHVKSHQSALLSQRNVTSAVLNQEATMHTQLTSRAKKQIDRRQLNLPDNDN